MCCRVCVLGEASVLTVATMATSVSILLVAVLAAVVIAAVVIAAVVFASVVIATILVAGVEVHSVKGDEVCALPFLGGGNFLDLRVGSGVESFGHASDLLGRVRVACQEEHGRHVADVGSCSSDQMGGRAFHDAQSTVCDEMDVYFIV